MRGAPSRLAHVPDQRIETWSGRQVTRSPGARASESHPEPRPRTPALWLGRLQPRLPECAGDHRSEGLRRGPCSAVCPAPRTPLPSRTPAGPSAHPGLGDDVASAEGRNGPRLQQTRPWEPTPRETRGLRTSLPRAWTHRDFARFLCARKLCRSVAHTAAFTSLLPAPEGRGPISFLFFLFFSFSFACGSPGFPSVCGRGCFSSLCVLSPLSKSR